MVHAAALIHDDSVDKSDLRRGLPTVNGLWTDEMAIIMGDYLYAQAMTLLVETQARHGRWAILARVVTEMSCGEALEFQYAYRPRRHRGAVRGADPRQDRLADRRPPPRSAPG